MITPCLLYAQWQHKTLQYPILRPLPVCLVRWFNPGSQQLKTKILEWAVGFVSLCKLNCVTFYTKKAYVVCHILKDTGLPPEFLTQISRKVSTFSLTLSKSFTFLFQFHSVGINEPIEDPSVPQLLAASLYKISSLRLEYAQLSPHDIQMIVDGVRLREIKAWVVSFG